VKCKWPYRAGLLEAGCGRCLPCRINRQRLWCIRCLLEAGEHSHSLFVTLTYSDEKLPADGSVSVRALQLFFKRLRKRIGPFRYFGCAEYGERNWRPHYHALLFGVRDSGAVREAWQDGFVHVSGVGPESIGYVAGYCLKGAYNAKGMKWHGKPELKPEFSLMSRRPGLGASAAKRIGAFLSTEAGSTAISRDKDVPSVVRSSKKKWPLGRYLRAIVRSEAGLDAAAISKLRQLSSGSVLKSMNQEEMNSYIDRVVWQSEKVGLEAEARYNRKRLERKL